MYRFLFKPKWILFHVLVVAMVVLMVNLGLWQKHRLEDRRDFNAEVSARSVEPVMPIDELVTGAIDPAIDPAIDSAVDSATDPATVQWRTVTATGTYLADEQVLIVNRAQVGITGVNVVTPLELTDGRLVLINRGFIPDTQPVPAPADGEVQVTGRLRETQERTLGGLTEAEGDLTELFRIDIPRLAAQLPGPVLSVYVDLLSSEPDQGQLPIPLPDPELGEGSHLSYMFQWWIFAVCVVVGWVLAVRRSISQHRRDVDRAATPTTPTPATTATPATTPTPARPAATASGDVSERDGRTPPDSPTPAGDEATTAHG